MSAGPKRHRITIQRVERTENAYGEAVDAWVDDAVLWASVEPLRGDEFFKGHLPQAQATVDTRMRIRHRNGLNPATNRIIYQGVVYGLIAVLADNQRKEMQLMVKAAAVQQPDGSTVNV
jgi:SPP1 family predicted phage head-tail adaptor